jgi:hypothetical protein
MSVLGRFLPLLEKISASAFLILCKDDLRIGKGEDNSDKYRNLDILFDSALGHQTNQ